jgi:hypothetical protein
MLNKDGYPLRYRPLNPVMAGDMAQFQGQTYRVMSCREKQAALSWWLKEVTRFRVRVATCSGFIVRMVMLMRERLGRNGH